MPDSITWVTLPRGVDRDRGTALFTLYASPEVDSPSAQVGDSVLGDWPGVVRGLLRELRLHAAGELVPVEITGVVPDTQPGRAGVSVSEDASLVPFQQLMRDLEERRALEQLKKKELER